MLAKGVIENNHQAIYDAVLPWLSSREIPFIFTSSSLAATSGTVLGDSKRMGEEQILAKCPKGEYATGN